MDRQIFSEVIKEIRKLSRFFNKNPKGWNYLTSIDYMLSSRLYLDSVFKDIEFFEKRVKDKERILDFGTGCGYLSILLSHNFKEVYGLDTSDFKTIEESSSKKDYTSDFKDMIHSRKLLWQSFPKNFSNVNFLSYNGKEIPFENDFFDAVLAYAVIEHIPEELRKKILTEINRVLKKGGKLFIFKLPQKFSINEFLCRIFKVESHQKLFTKKEIEELLRGSDFKVNEISYSDFVFEFPPKFANFLYHPFKLIDRIISKTPLKYFGHNLNILAVKNENINSKS